MLYAKFRLLLVGIAIVFVHCHLPAAADDTPDSAPPKVRVVSVRKVFDNGEHNAFTDLCRYKGRSYLTLRSCPDGHMVFSSSSIIVMVSDDTRQWQQVHRFHVPNRDTRDPHFLVFHDKLFVYTGTWYAGEDKPAVHEINDHLGYAVWSDDGVTWHGPKMLEGTYGHYIWRAATYGGKAYLCGRRKHEFVHTNSRAERDPWIESAMLESDDGLVWRTATLFQEHYGDETAFQFDPDGSVLALCRSGGGRNAQVCRSVAPYQTWQRIDLDRYVGGPLLVKWKGHYLVGGRKTIGTAVTALYWLVDDQLQEIAELPSGGDNSYPGFVETGPNSAALSYYSSHEKDAQGKTITAIYIAELVAEP